MPKETEFERFRRFSSKIVSVPKTEIDRREKEYQRTRKKMRKRKL